MRLIALLLVWSMAVYVHVGPSTRAQNQPAGGTDTQKLIDHVNDADRIVKGSVSSVTSRYTSTENGDHLIMSTIVIAVDETLKGRKASTVTVQTIGGTVGTVTMGTSDYEATFTAGDSVVAFIARDFVIPQGWLKLDAAGNTVSGHASVAQVRAAIRGEI
jgi:hypothetical protein